jgi:hypothetical protein
VPRHEPAIKRDLVSSFIAANISPSPGLVHCARMPESAHGHSPNHDYGYGREEGHANEPKPVFHPKGMFVAVVHLRSSPRRSRGSCKALNSAPSQRTFAGQFEPWRLRLVWPCYMLGVMSFYVHHDTSTSAHGSTGLPAFTAAMGTVGSIGKRPNLARLVGPRFCDLLGGRELYEEGRFLGL